MKTKVSESCARGHDVWLDLFEDTIALAVEDGSSRDSSSFVAYMQEMLPLEVMNSLENLSGSSSVLEDIWMERFSSVESDVLEEEGSFLGDKCCVMCERDNVRLTRHHLYPRETHSALIKKGAEKAKLQETIPVCGMCHGTIHRFFTNSELSAEYFTLDRLMSNEKIYRFATWASKQSKRKRS
jgi:hypothetical protein